MLYETAHRREQPEDDQHQRYHKADVAAGDAGQLDHAVVLAEAGVREGVEDRGNKGVEAVSQHAAFQTFHIQRTGDRLLGDIGGGGDIADGFQGGDHKHQHQRQQQAPVDAEAIVQRCRNGDEAAVGRGGVGRQHIEEPRRQIARRHGNHQRSDAQIGITLAVENDDQRQHDARQQQVLRRAEGVVGHRRVAAADGGQSDLNQRQADNHHHHAGDQRGNDAARQMQDAGENHFRAAGQHQGAEQGGHHCRDVGAAGFQRGAAHDEWGDKVEAGALNGEQSGTDRAPGFDLNNGGHAGGEQRHADDMLGILRRETESLAD